MSKMVQKTFKVPEAWSIELTKMVGEQMVKTGIECSFASFVKDVLDDACGLSKKTGVDSEGSPTPQTKPDSVAKSA